MAAQSRKLYEDIADCFANFNRTNPKLLHRERVLLYLLAHRIARTFHGGNTSFDFQRFVDACNLPEIRE